MVGASEAMRQIYALIEQIAPSSASVLITGESGTGKEMVARTIHTLSPRREAPFIAINCSAIPETLMESELFGHERGAF
ncbi:sigma 54-interacting transcriptional regulator, partial [Acinetobacter baumannii]